ncbi:MAG TPA: hypothetical protein VGO93_31430 [Candidatus Xenobia bacterium]|jgi:hypothetical protein
MGMVGRASVVPFAGVTQWTYMGKQMNGIRFIQMHPKVAADAGKPARALLLFGSCGGALGIAGPGREPSLHVESPVDESNIREDRRESY